MKIFQQKRKMMSRLYSRWTIFALFVVIILLARGVYDIYTREVQSSKMKAESEDKLSALMKEKADLSSKIDKLNSDAGVDSEIRTKFNVAKPGENVVLIVDDSSTSTASTTPGFFASLWAKIWK